ncbi:MAG: hypothetical protein ACFE9S_13050 [Candidatus Hermodarchaeota archaeon]
MVFIINKGLFIEEDQQKRTKVELVCPVCHANGQVNIPRNVLKDHGLTTISIPSNSMCEHNFQIFLDQHSSVRGYQKVDFEIIPKSLNSTEFTCLMCNAEILFNINDENTYLKKKVNEKFLGKETYSYEVAHYHDNELHVNNILVDGFGKFQDYLNTYKIKLENYAHTEKKSQRFFKLSNEGQKPLESHPFFKIFLIFNTFNNWLFELVSPSQFNTVELTNLVYSKMEESFKVYSSFPDYLNIPIAENIFHVWISGSNIICINLNDGIEIEWIKSIIKDINRNINYDGNLIAKSPRILLISDFYSGIELNDKQKSVINRLIFDDLLHSKIKIKFEERLKRIIERISDNFKMKPELINNFFNQERSIIEYLRKSENTTYLEKFIEILDFINRRKLLE